MCEGNDITIFFFKGGSQKQVKVEMIKYLIYLGFLFLHSNITLPKMAGVFGMTDAPISFQILKKRNNHIQKVL